MFFRKRLIISLEDRARLIYASYINKKLYIEAIFSMEYEELNSDFFYELRMELDKRKIRTRNIELLINQEKFSLESLLLPKLDRNKTKKLTENRIKNLNISNEYRRKIDLQKGKRYNYLQILKIRKDFILNAKEGFQTIGLDLKKLSPLNFSLANVFHKASIDKLYDCSKYNILLINLNHKYLDIISQLIRASLSYIYESFNITIDSYILVGQYSKEQKLVNGLESRLNISFMDFNGISSFKNLELKDSKEYIGVMSGFI